jgi:hypothetical protein
MTRHRHHARIKLRSLYVWHRYLGVSAAVFVIVLAASGLALNHTEILRLDERHVRSQALLGWYGIEAPEPGESYAAGAHIVTRVGERLFLDTTPLPGEYRELTGVVAAPGLLIVVADGNALLLTPQGELIERLSGEDGVPAGIQAVGLNPTQGGGGGGARLPRPVPARCGALELDPYGPRGRPCALVPTDPHTAWPGGQAPEGLSGPYPAPGARGPGPA